MVQSGALNIQLVEAQSKVAFKEHTGEGGKIFVEVEPDAEYFIAIKKTKQTDTDIKVKFVVDGKDLGYSSNLSKTCIDNDNTHDFKGLWQVKNGQSNHKALKFVKHVSVDGSNKDPSPFIGSVTVKVFESSETEKRNSCWNHTTNLEPASGAASRGVASRKSVRSSMGTATTEATQTGKRNVFKRGKLIETITMHYCAAAGLVEAGVLSKPTDIWECHRKYPTKKSAVSDSSEESESDSDEPLEIYSARTEANGKHSSSSNDSKPAAKKKCGSQEDYYFQCKAEAEMEKKKKLRIENAREIAKNRMEWKAKGMSDEDIDKLFPIG